MHTMRANRNRLKTGFSRHASSAPRISLLHALGVRKRLIDALPEPVHQIDNHGPTHSHNENQIYRPSHSLTMA